MNYRHVFVTLSTVAALALAACGPTPQQQQAAAYQAGMQAAQQQQVQPQPVSNTSGQAPVYGSVQECQNDPNNPNPNLCAASFAQSQQALPHYSSAYSCQAQGYADCHDYGGWFGPAFAGFMLGSYLNGGYHPYPIYVGAGGMLYGNGYSLGYRPVRSYYGGYYHYGAPAHTVVVIHSTPSAVYRTSVPAAAYSHTIAAPAPTIQRGGFGATQAGASMNAARPAGMQSSGQVMAASRPATSAPAFHPAAAPAFRPSTPSFTPRPASTGGFGGGFSSHSSGGGSFHSSGGSHRH